MSHDRNTDEIGGRPLLTLGEGVPAKKDWDQINPSHYRTRTDFRGPDGEPFQVIHVIELFDLDAHRASALRYLLRNEKKPGVDPLVDLEKCKWFIERRIKYLKGSKP
jgi:hypothetical protein